MKSIFLTICIAIVLSASGSFAQSISTTGTPSQETFNFADAGQSTPTTETSSQGSYELENSGQSASVTGTNPASAMEANNLAISNVIKEGDALHAIVANNGTTSANLSGWKLTLNNGTSTYSFQNFVLQPKSMVTIHTHMGTNTPIDLFGSNFIWNGTRDVELLNDQGMLMSEYRLGVP